MHSGKSGCSLNAVNWRWGAHMKFRPQRGSLDAAMEEVVELDGMDALKAHLHSIGWHDGAVRVEPYTYDERIGWDTHIVTIDGNAVGFTDGPVEQS